MAKAHSASSRALTARAWASRRSRLVQMVAALPEAAAAPCGDRHFSLEVRGKRFGWLLDDHHGDGRLALACKAPTGASQALVAAAPDRFHLPPYVARHGWLGLWLDQPTIDWEEVGEVLADAYRLTAPKTLVAQLRG